MFTLRCENCGEEYHADERHAGRLIQCTRCDHTIHIVAPKPYAPPPEASPGPSVAPWHSVSEKGRPVPIARRNPNYTAALIGVLLLVIFGLYIVFSERPQPNRITSNGSAGRTTEPRSASVASPRTPAEQLQDQIVSSDAGRLGNLKLNTEFGTINAKYFANRLPAMPVIWEPRLQEVGPLIAKDFTLEGLAASNNHRQFILINSALRNSRQELRRALCHEMVHEYLFTEGDTKTNHGPAFQKILRRLSEEGAFKGKWASPSEKANLKKWLHGEAAKLEAESSNLAAFQKKLEGDQAELHDQLTELDERISAANARQSGWPSQQEVESFKSRRSALNQQGDAYNRRVEEYRHHVARYNHEVNSFNLIMAYPDGLDEESLVKPKLPTITYSSAK